MCWFSPSKTQLKDIFYLESKQEKNSTLQGWITLATSFWHCTRIWMRSEHCINCSNTSLVCLKDSAPQTCHVYKGMEVQDPVPCMSWGDMPGLSQCRDCKVLLGLPHPDPTAPKPIPPDSSGSKRFLFLCPFHKVAPTHLESANGQKDFGFPLGLDGTSGSSEGPGCEDVR